MWIHRRAHPLPYHASTIGSDALLAFDRPTNMLTVHTWQVLPLRTCPQTGIRWCRFHPTSDRQTPVSSFLLPLPPLWSAYEYSRSSFASFLRNSSWFIVGLFVKKQLRAVHSLPKAPIWTWKHTNFPVHSSDSLLQWNGGMTQIIVVINLMTELEVVEEGLSVVKTLVNPLPIFNHRSLSFPLLHKPQCSIGQHELHNVVLFLS